MGCGAVTTIEQTHIDPLRRAVTDPAPRLSLVVPAYNEAERLSRSIPRLLEVIPFDETEVIIVDDGSTDSTSEVALLHLAGLPRSSVIRLPHNCGKGAAVRAGVVEARGEIIAYMDADMATEPGDLALLIDALRDSPVAIGSRTLESSVVQDKSGLRNFMTRTFGLVVSSAVDLPMRDTQCGFKAFHGSVAKLLFHGAQVDSFAFDIEVLARASRLGLETAEVPVRWTDMAGSKVRVVRDSVKMVFDVGRTRRRRVGNTPIHGVVMTDTNPGEGGDLLRSCVRPVDTVLSWDDGVIALFPCVPPTVAANRVREIQAAVPTHRLQHVELTLDTLERAGFGPARALA
jgi:glycosyltransferase involved in cell wall biosynthesis